MSLADHLRELRYRIIISAIFVTIGLIISLVFNDWLLGVILQPWQTASEMISERSPHLDVQAVLSGVTSALILRLKVAAVGGLVLASPFWLYQVWAFIAPGLLAKEKKYALAFLGAAVPLFLSGVVIAYVIVSQAITILLSFTPQTVQILNLLDVEVFLGLLLQLMIVFGVGFIMPVVIVALNLMGIVSAKALKSARPYVVFGSFVFGAAATPGGDPFSMMALGTPMALLFLAAEAVCHGNDKRKRARLAAQGLLVE